MWNHSSFLQFTLIPLGNFLLLGGPTKGALTLFLSTLQWERVSFIPRSSVYPVDVYIYPQMSSPMLSPLSAWGLYKLASARVSLSEIGFTWHGQCNNDIGLYFYNIQQTWNLDNKKNQTVFSLLTIDVQNLLYLSWSPPLAHSGAVQELLKTKRGATCTGGGGHLVTVTQLLQGVTQLQVVI